MNKFPGTMVHAHQTDKKPSIDVAGSFTLFAKLRMPQKHDSLATGEWDEKSILSH